MIFAIVLMLYDICTYIKQRGSVIRQGHRRLTLKDEVKDSYHGCF